MKHALKQMQYRGCSIYSKGVGANLPDLDNKKLKLSDLHLWFIPGFLDKKNPGSYRPKTVENDEPLPEARARQVRRHDTASFLPVLSDNAKWFFLE